MVQPLSGYIARCLCIHSGSRGRQCFLLRFHIMRLKVGARGLGQFRWLTKLRHLLSSMTTRVWLPEPTRWKERTVFHDQPSVHMYPQANTGKKKKMNVRTKLTPHCFYQEPLPTSLTTARTHWLITTGPWKMIHPKWSSFLIWSRWEISFTLSFGRTSETLRNRKALGFYGNPGFLLLLPFPEDCRSANKRRDTAFLLVFQGLGSVRFHVHTPALTRVKYKRTCSLTVTSWRWTVTKPQSILPWLQPAAGLWATWAPAVRRGTPLVCQCLLKTVPQYTHF